MLIRKKLQADRRDKKDWHGQGNLPGKLASGAKIAYNVIVYLFAFSLSCRNRSENRLVLKGDWL